MPRTIVIEDWQEFADRHGGSLLRVGNDLIFPDGAAVHPSNRDMRMEPPEDPMARLELRRLYLHEAVKRAEKLFYDTQHKLLEHAQMARLWPNQWQAPKYGPQQLARLKANHDNLVTQLEQVYAAMTNTPEAQRKRASDAETEAFKYKARDEAEELAKEIEAISL